jgi:hypothetical protein
MGAKKKYVAPACTDLDLPTAQGQIVPLSICRNGAAAGGEPIYCTPGNGALVSCRTGSGRGHDCSSGGQFDV